MKHEIFVFSKTNYNNNIPEENRIKINKPYLLIEKKITKEIINFGDRIGDDKETSYFYEIDENHQVNTSKKYEVLTNWWHTEASFKNARIMGFIESKIVYSKISYYSDFKS